MLIKRSLIYIYLFISLLAVELPLQAMADTALYQAILPVNSQTATERQKLLPQAMAQVLIKVSGNPHLADNANVRNYLTQAARYIQQYHYANSSGAKPMLLITFNATAIDNVLQKFGQPKWAGERSSILIWLATETNGNHVVVDEIDKIGQLVKLTAQQYGIPVIFPANDLEDMQQVTIDNLWAPNINPILQTMKRYQADKILAGRITQINSQAWSIQWQVGNSQELHSVNANATSLDDVIQQGFGQVLSKLANSSLSTNIESGPKQKKEIIVNGVTGLSDYQKVQDFLQNIPSVQSVQVLNVGADQITFNIVIQGTEDELISAIAQGNLLTAMPQTDKNALEYELKL
jgi:hypothetical protein